MQLTTEGNMLNFGYWGKNIFNPLDAQISLSKIVGKFASLETARILADVGSGYSAPALQWSSQYDLQKIICINTNIKQLKFASTIVKSQNQDKNKSTKSNPRISGRDNIFHINATSTMLPIRNVFVDRVIAFESAQHFKPFVQFLQESHRILNRSGFLIIAIPVIIDSSKLTSFLQFIKLGILSVTWASEHYELRDIITMINTSGFQIVEIQNIGEKVYPPLADYYIKNREKLRDKVIREYPKLLETILYKSILKMKSTSEKGYIDYILLKARKL